jgi:hypothetical protein
VRRSMWFWYLVAVICLAHGGQAAQPRSGLTWSYGIVSGQTECTCKAPRWSTVAELPLVQALVVTLTTHSLSAQEIDAALHSSGTTRAELESLGFIRRQSALYSLAFPLFTSADMETIRIVSGRYAHSLSSSLLARRVEIERAALSYSTSVSDRKAMLFIVLGYFSLDLGGMELTGKNGYRLTLQQHVDGSYVPFGVTASSSAAPDIFSYGVSRTINRVTMASFGDAPKSERETFPELLSDNYHILTVSDSAALAAQELGEIMFLLRAHPSTKEEVAKAAGISPNATKIWLEWLLQLGYISQSGDRYSFAIPVLSEQDRKMVRAVRQICTEVMTEWLATHYARLRDELSNTTPSRCGIPFTEQFNVVWPILFGSAVRDLIDADLIANPYKSNRERGYIPVVYDAALIQTRDMSNMIRWGSAVTITVLIVVGVMWRSRWEGRKSGLRHSREDL